MIEQIFKTHGKAIAFMRKKKEATLSGKKGSWIVRWEDE